MSDDEFKRPDPSWFWISDKSFKEMDNIDRMPIHHKLTEKRRIKRKKKPVTEGRSLIRSKTYMTLSRGGSRSDMKLDPRATTPTYLKDVFDYDNSSNSEDNASEDEKDKKTPKPLDISQKVYLAACERSGITPRRKLVTRLADDKFVANNFLLAPEDITALSFALITNDKVSSLDLSGNTIGREGMESLVQMLEENMTITELKLSHTKLGLYEVTLLTEMISDNLLITSLDVAGNDLDDECAKCFAEALKYNRKLKYLNLSCNKFQENGGKILAKSIETNDSILDLDMSWNHIRLTGAQAWGEALYKNEELRHLNLSWNGFCDDGAIALGDAIQDNNTLLSLDLTSNRIGHEGCRAFSKALKVNTALQTLTLSQNPITTQGSLELLTAINENEGTNMQSLIIEGVQIVHEAHDIAEEIKEHREDFTLVHSGYVISPDILTLRTPALPEKKCRSTKS